MADEIPLTHWSSTIMSLNPQRLSHEYATIIQGIYCEEAVLSLRVKREFDGLEDNILLASGFEEEDPTDPVAIRNLYKPFNVQKYSELVGRNVMGVYYNQRKLVGIQAIND